MYKFWIGHERDYTNLKKDSQEQFKIDAIKFFKACQIFLNKKGNLVKQKAKATEMQGKSFCLWGV